MSSKVWMSSLRSNSGLGDKQGLRTKFYGEDWAPASFLIPVSSDAVRANMTRSARGYALQREELPEAAAIWNEKSFQKIREITWAGGFLIVRGKLAEILSRFDLGEGGLVPFPVYKADLVTPYPSEFFLLNFGARKNSFLPESSESVARMAVDRKTGQQIWKVNSWRENGDVAVSADALAGPDLWYEEVVHGKIFMGEALAIALAETEDANEWRLVECNVVENQS
jgi:hypothetical protein